MLEVCIDSTSFAKVTINYDNLEQINLLVKYL